MANRKNYSVEEKLQIARAEAWASRYLDYRREVEGLDDAIFAHMEMACSLRSALSMANGGTGGRPGDRPCDSVQRLNEIEEKLRDEASKLMAAYERISAAIDRVEEPRLRTLLRYRYMCGSDWSAIAKRLHYADEKHVSHDVHFEALLALGDPEIFILQKQIPTPSHLEV